MPARKDPNKLTLDDVTVVQYHELEKKSLDETAKLMNVSRETVKRIKKKPAYRDLAVAAMEDKKRFVDVWLEKLWEQTEAHFKRKKPDGEYEEIPDNTNRLKAIIKGLDIFGVEPPKEYDLQHSLATKSDEELAEELERAKQEYRLDETESPDDGDAVKPV